MAVLEGFKKVSIALVGAFGLAGAVFFGFKVAGAFVAADYRHGILGRAALAPPPPAIGTDFLLYRLPCY
jgi:hypothetical protein